MVHSPAQVAGVLPAPREPYLYMVIAIALAMDRRSRHGNTNRDNMGQLLKWERKRFQFFEQVGYAARRGYLDITDVLYLFATGLRDLDVFTHEHFKKPAPGLAKRLRAHQLADATGQKVL